MYYSRKLRTVSNILAEIKINAAGVIPVILAGSIFMLPQIVEALFFNNNVKPDWLIFVFSALTCREESMLTYALIVILFTFFYAQVQINQRNWREPLNQMDLHRRLRPGEDTENTCLELNQLSIIGVRFIY